MKEAIETDPSHCCTLQSNDKIPPILLSELVLKPSNSPDFFDILLLLLLLLLLIALSTPNYLHFPNANIEVFRYH